MGQQASQLERADFDVLHDEHSVSQSPVGDHLRQDTEHDDESSSINTSSQDFAFSSQVPLSPSRKSRPSRKRSRTSIPKFEKSSQSPESAIVKAEPDINSLDQDSEAVSPKAAKRKRGKSKKRQSLTEQGNLEEEDIANGAMAKKTASTTEPMSSMDLDGIKSSPGDGQASSLGDVTDQQQAKRDRKERKKAKKAAKQAEQLRASLLAANPNFGAHDDPESLGQGRQSQMHFDHVADSNVEDGASNEPGRLGSQRSKGSAQTNVDMQTESKNEAVDDSRMEDPNQLPTPDDEGQSNVLPINTNSHVQASSAANAHSSAQPSGRKRKSKDSDKKSRKRQREEASDSASKAPRGESADVAMTGTTSVSPAVDERSSAVPELPGSTSRIGDLAREYYSQRYASKNSTPTKSNMAAVSNKRLRLAGLETFAPDDSPSAARQQRQATSARSSSERPESPVSKHIQDAADSMDLDADDDYVNESHLGSDDLGADINERLDEDDSAVPNERQALESPAHEPAASNSKSKSKTARQSGSKSSATKTRHAKSSYLDREAHDNVQAFNEMPSPAVIAASRKGKGRAKNPVPESNATDPSHGQQGSEKQAKITDLMMRTRPSSAGSSSQRPSATPAPTFTRMLSKKVTRLANPKPEAEETGPFTGNDIRNLKEAIDKWRDMHDLTDVEINDMVQKNPQEAKTTDFWNYVHHSCPNRKRQKVINQVRKTHHNFVARATWTKEQHDELAELYEIHGKNFKLLGQLINRHPADVRDRIRNYVVCGDKRRTDVWDHEEEAKLITILNEAFEKIRELKAHGRSDLNPQDDEELVDWAQVSENMEHTRSRLQCQVKWKHLRLRMEGGNIDGKAGHSMADIIQTARDDFKKMTNKDLFLICKAIKKSGTTSDSRIGWAKLRNTWWAMEQWNRPALMLAWHRLSRSMPGWTSNTQVPEIARYQMDKYQESKKVHILPESEMDMDAETQALEHKVGKIIRNTKMYKTPHFAVKSDDEDDEEDVENNEVDVGRPQRLNLDAQDENDLEIQESENGSQQGDEPSEEYAEAAAREAETKKKSKPKTRRSSQKIRPTIEQSPEAQPSKASHGTSTLPNAQGKDSARSRAAGKARAKPSRARKSKVTKTIAQDDAEVSSDTDADDVEDIPAVLPD
ncbi:hypothetical protein PFICI_14478 [Pestalotiopsis fici W106-1]|uniref:Myb-like domain-containing protein n=1 Tax=Pestalotiopsis fici (strain W106-1 / CGMCC3.15140) TaxID=1229662 RepID=W3WK45_PESFW|nr:uncharacterized protein PFICI_14478 [Pestalotiopsis fici W106-1]ETS73532.1 hypothetical protein PFICI_14478 [Pestalotiopsis fici W106-1]